MHQPSGAGQIHSSESINNVYIRAAYCQPYGDMMRILVTVTLFCACLMTSVPIGSADLLYHSCNHIIDNCNQDWSNKLLSYWHSNQPQTSLITCSLLLWPPAGLIFSCGVCVERATHPLHNNDGFCLHLPVFLLSASPAELQLFQCQPWRQRGALPHWHGEDDQV